MAIATILTKAQIGASGVLLIQYRLLKHGIESAPMTTDAGIDLAVYSPARKKALTVQVKTCLKPKPAGGRGRPALDWWLPSDSPADLVGLVNLVDDQAWIFRHSEFERVAQQKPQGRLHFYFYGAGDHPRHHANAYSPYLLENRLNTLFGQSAHG